MNTITSFQTIDDCPVTSARTITLGMAELQPDGISEQWFLKLCGDVHWSLIAKAMGQKRAVFEDVNGREVYAAFCATSLELQPRQDLLAQDVEIFSSIYRVSQHQIGSEHKIFLSGNEIASLSMISTFVCHSEDGLNTTIIRNKYMPSLALELAPQSLLDLAKKARNIARRDLDNENLGAPIDKITPCRSLDFNAVGLLYFPSFSKFAESIACSLNKSTKPLLKRDVVYLGNVDAGSALKFYSLGNYIYIKRDDGKLIAFISTQRSK